MFRRRRLAMDEYSPQPARQQPYPNLDVLFDYREYDGPWGQCFESWLKLQLAGLGYAHVRFFGGKRSGEDGSFLDRVCELRKPGEAVEYFVYG